MLGFIDTIDLYNRREIEELKGPIRLSTEELMYRRFLIYINFYASEKPVIVCEGDTDNVYLTHAIRSLAAEFPDLAEVDKVRIRLKVRLFKYPRTSTARILGLNDGGSSLLAKFIPTYKKETDRFKAPGEKNPFIILYDNDSGATGLRRTIEEVSKEAFTSKESFRRVVRNLYALPTPLPSGAKQSKIEDFFDAATKAITINGKRFDDRNNFETATHYGKKVFAHRVVRPNADTIDFAGFRPLLTNLVAIIASHRRSIPPPAQPTLLLQPTAIS
jgi:hypothetical protein